MSIVPEAGPHDEYIDELEEDVMKLIQQKTELSGKLSGAKEILEKIDLTKVPEGIAAQIREAIKKVT